jgi:hypothetical protein
MFPYVIAATGRPESLSLHIFCPPSVEVGFENTTQSSLLSPRGPLLQAMFWEGVMKPQSDPVAISPPGDVATLSGSASDSLSRVISWAAFGRLGAQCGKFSLELADRRQRRSGIAAADEFGRLLNFQTAVDGACSRLCDQLSRLLQSGRAR